MEPEENGICYVSKLKKVILKYVNRLAIPTQRRR